MEARKREFVLSLTSTGFVISNGQGIITQGPRPSKELGHFIRLCAEKGVGVWNKEQGIWAVKPKGKRNG